MNLDSLNKWLTLLANFGVIAGIAFLAVEISQQSESLDQSNRIAMTNAEASIRMTSSSLQDNIANNPETAALYVKFLTNEQLTPIEAIQSYSIASTLLQNWILAERCFQQGLLDEPVFNGLIMSIDNIIDSLPGLRPLIAQQYDVRLGSGQSPIVNSRILSALERNGQPILANPN